MNDPDNVEALVLTEAHLRGGVLGCDLKSERCLRSYGTPPFYSIIPCSLAETCRLSGLNLPREVELAVGSERIGAAYKKTR